MELGAELGPEKGGLADTCGGSESIQTTPDGQSEARRLTLGGGVRDDGEAGRQASKRRHGRRRSGVGGRSGLWLFWRMRRGEE